MGGHTEGAARNELPRFQLLDANQDDGINEEPEGFDESDRCSCTDPSGFSLSIEEGAACVIHTDCGKRPWFMFEDWIYSVNMGSVPIVVSQITGCSRYQCFTGSCDCGPEITLSLPGKD